MLRTLRRKWWFWVGGGLVTLLLLALAGVYAEWKVTRSRGEARRAAAVARLDAEDPNWRAADLCAARNATIPPPEENAGERALKAVNMLPKSFNEWATKEQLRADLKPGHLPDPDELCDAVGVYEEAMPAVEVARTVRDLRRGGFRLVFKDPNPLGTLLPNTQKMREAANLLDVDALMLSVEGRPDDAIRSCHALLNCTRAIGDEPTLISQLVRIAIGAIAKTATERALGLGEPTRGLAELQAAFLEEMNVPRMTYGLRGERASFYLLMNNIDDGSLDLGDLERDTARDGGSLRGRAGSAFLRKYIPGQQATAIEMFNEMIAADKLKGPERRAAYDRVKLPPRGLSNLFVWLLMPACEKVMLADLRARAYYGTAAAALACERYRRKFGRWPASLLAIPKDILREVPEDPYVGGPIQYKRTDDGVVVYTTGPDGTDDGGVTLDPKGEKGTDVGFRLFDPDQRRRPPLPKEEVVPIGPPDAGEPANPGGPEPPPAERVP